MRPLSSPPSLSPPPLWDRCSLLALQSLCPLPGPPSPLPNNQRRHHNLQRHRRLAWRTFGPRSSSVESLSLPDHHTAVWNNETPVDTPCFQIRFFPSRPSHSKAQERWRPRLASPITTTVRGRFALISAHFALIFVCGLPFAGCTPCADNWSNYYYGPGQCVIPDSSLAYYR